MKLSGYGEQKLRILLWMQASGVKNPYTLCGIRKGEEKQSSNHTSIKLIFFLSNFCAIQGNARASGPTIWTE